MKTLLYFVGKTLQLIGIGTVLIAFIHFFSRSPMDDLMKLAIIGTAEFYIGNFIVTRTGVKKDGSD